MLEFLNCVSLYSAIPKIQKVNFDRELIAENEAEINMAIRTDIAENTEDSSPTKVKFTFAVKAEASAEDDTLIFEAILEVEYFFRIVDLDAYNALTDKDQLNLCGNLTYLDFRRRLAAILSSVGMSGFKIPMSLMKFNGDMK